MDYIELFRIVVFIVASMSTICVGVFAVFGVVSWCRVYFFGRVWIVGLIDSGQGSSWSLAGVYLNKKIARKKCSSPQFFIVPLTVGFDLPSTDMPPGIEFPFEPTKKGGVTADV